MQANQNIAPMLRGGVLWLLGFVSVYPPPKVDPGAVELPLVEHPEDRRRLYVEWEGRIWFLDTGYASTTCDTDFVDELGLRRRKTLSWSKGSGGLVRLEATRLPAFELGEAHIGELRCAVRDLGSTSSIPDDVAGVLGMNLLGRFVLEVDLVDEVIRLHDPSTWTEEGMELRRDFGSWRLKAPVTTAEDTRWALLDTGATGTWLEAAKMDLELRGSDVIPVTGTGGTTVMEVRYYRAEGLGIGGLPAEGLVVVRERDRGKELVGMDMLSSYEGFWIDVREAELGLSPR